MNTILVLSSSAIDFTNIIFFLNFYKYMLRAMLTVTLRFARSKPGIINCIY